MLRSHDPSEPEREVFAVAEPVEAELSARLDAALAAWERWAADAPNRSAALHALADSIADRGDAFAELMVREVGKPVSEARGETARAAAILRYYAQAALGPTGETFPGPAPGIQVHTAREPLGAIVAICPWNFPLAIPLWKAAPALAYGNVVLLKPSTAALAVADLLSEAAAEALPADVLAVAPLSGARAAGLLDDHRVAAVTFTGSTDVGLSVAARMAGRAAPAQCEMGGRTRLSSSPIPMSRPPPTRLSPEPWGMRARSALRRAARLRLARSPSRCKQHLPRASKAWWSGCRATRTLSWGR